MIWSASSSMPRFRPSVLDSPPWSVTQIGLRCCLASSIADLVRSRERHVEWTRSASAIAGASSHDITSSGCGTIVGPEDPKRHTRLQLGPKRRGTVRDQLDLARSARRLDDADGQIQGIPLASPRHEASSK